MLPTTGYFKSISCPFFDACICERPYCHYKHSKRESISDSNLISELVSKAVHKVLNVNHLNLSSNADSAGETSDEAVTAPSSSKSITYNPTPISELNKYKSSSSDKIDKKSNRHIPIQYTPERPVRSVNASYSTASEYVVEDSSNTNIGYSPTPRSFSSISYIPSSIKTLSSKSNDASQESQSQPYVPSNSLLNDSQTDLSDSVLTVKYSPTRNLDIIKQCKDEYVPNYAGEYSNGYFPSTNLYETENVTQIQSSPSTNIQTNEEKTCTTHSNQSATSKSSTSKERKSDKERKSSSSKHSQKHSSRRDNNRSNGHTEKRRSSSDKHKNSSDKHKASSDKHKSSDNRKTSSDNHKNSSDKHKTSSDKHKTSSDKHKSNSDKQQKSSSDKNKGSSDKHKTSNDNHKSNSDSKHTHGRDKSTKDKYKPSSRSDKSKSNDKMPYNSRKDKQKAKDTKKEKKIEQEPLLEPESDSSPERDDILLSNDDTCDSDSDNYTTTLEECKRIFEEYIPELNMKQGQEECADCEKHAPEDAAIPTTAKKRVAHEKSFNIIRDPLVKAKRQRNAAMVMANRYNALISSATKNNSTVQPGNTSNAADEKLAQKRKSTQVVNSGVKMAAITMNLGSSSSQVISNTQENTSVYYQPPAKQRRIAHVPNVSSLLNAKKKVEEIAKTQELIKTPVQTVAKGSKRLAHVPELSLAEIPPVLQAERSKLPVNVRTRYLHLMIKECTKLYISKEAAYERALNEELNCYTKCSATSTYRNSSMLTINRLRKELETGQSQMSSGSDIAAEFVGERFYENVSKWILSDEQLLENGFPRRSPESGRALFKDPSSNVCDSVPMFMKVCARCKNEYRIDENGLQVGSQDCVYHPGGRYYFRGEHIYGCCRGNAFAGGCAMAATHVFETKNPAELTGFVRTFLPDGSKDKRSTDVYALDCEMIYTTRGVELARVTVINHKCAVVYESLVRPMGEILDYNTRFSGITEEAMEGVTANILDVQAALLLMFNSQTILIGHSLENDLIAMRIIHDTVIDTSVMFPHKMGPPKKRGLRTLASEFLKKIIQNNEGGHDSAEDAITCMELVKWKLREYLKTR